MVYNKGLFYFSAILNIISSPQCSGGGNSGSYTAIPGGSNFVLAKGWYPFWSQNAWGYVQQGSYASSGFVAASPAPNFNGGLISLPTLPSGASGGPFPPSGFTIEFWSMKTVCNDPSCGGGQCAPYYEPGSQSAQLLSLGDENGWTNGFVSVTQNCGCAQGVAYGGCSCSTWGDPLCGQTIGAQVYGTAWSVRVKSPPLGAWAHLAFVFTSAPAVAGATGASATYNLVASAFINGSLVGSSTAQQTGPPPDPVSLLSRTKLC